MWMNTHTHFITLYDILYATGVNSQGYGCIISSQYSLSGFVFLCYELPFCIEETLFSTWCGSLGTGEQVDPPPAAAAAVVCDHLSSSVKHHHIGSQLFTSLAESMTLIRTWDIIDVAAILMSLSLNYHVIAHNGDTGNIIRREDEVLFIPTDAVMQESDCFGLRYLLI